MGFLNKIDENILTGMFFNVKIILPLRLRTGERVVLRA